MRRSSIVSTLTVVLALACAGRGGGEEVEIKTGRVLGDPVSPGVWRLHGTDPNLANADLAPLKTLLGRATVVGLGESVHTSGGFYEMKHRLIRYLVSQAGFRVVAWETPWIGADQLAGYVETCGGDLDQDMSQIIDLWVSEETRDLFRWMCDWNRSHRRAQDRVHFLGFDIQNGYGQVQANAAYLRAFLGRVGIPAEDERSAGVEACNGVGSVEPFGNLNPERVTRCLAATDALSGLFQRQAASLTRLTSKNDLALAKIHLIGLRAWEDQSREQRNTAPEYSARDKGMADTLVALRALRYPKAKTIVWAHNYHLGKGNTDRLSPGFVWMGSHLARTLGSSYFAIGLGSVATEVDWPDVACGLVDEYGKDPSIERTLHDLGEGDLLVDLRRSGVIPRVIPAGYQTLGPEEILADREFDALVYLDHSPKMHPLLWPSCR